jgi:hypothetical protein
MSDQWKKSSACNADGCVEVAVSDEEIKVRDSKLGGESDILKFTPEAWADFKEAMIAGRV